MNKSELINAIHDELESESLPVKRVTIEAVVESLGHVVTMHFAAADPFNDAEVVLPGLGKLKTTTRAARTGRNPQTGVPVEIPARIAVKFSTGKGMKLVELLQHAVECERGYMNHETYAVGEQPRVAFTMVRPGQIHMPKGAGESMPASSSRGPRLLK